MRPILLLLCGVLAACSTPEPVIVRPEIPERLAGCAAGPGPLPEIITPRELFARDYQWQVSHAECRERLRAVVGIVEGGEANLPGD